ncbi:hypothetical protein KIN20_011481 [Parelaphostrongylus tenuis]|uniref:IBB domain-containing protein n=1 Tax=Parelaphostrongylus tenuis TaxID=148309 RepID=A0AAD5N089_PARTN|nr:hypothetical protein KIN20_011481 [Parelaphostrongylus tenuis]
MEVTEDTPENSATARDGCQAGAMSSSNSDAGHHESLYKLRGLSKEELRKRRRISEVQIRKQKQEEFFNHRRRLDNDEVEFTLADDCCIIPKAVLDMIKSGIFQNELAGLKFLRSKIAESAEDVNCMSRLGDISLISLLTRLLIRGDDDLIDDVSWILVNMFRRHENRPFTEDVRGQVLPTFCSLIHRAACPKNGAPVPMENSVLSQLLWSVATLVESSVANKGFVISSGVVQDILRIASRNKKLVILRHIMFLAAVLFSDIQEFTPDLIELFPLLTLISRHLSSEDLTIQSDAVRACRFMSECADFFEPMSDAGIQGKLVSLLPSSCTYVLHGSLRSIANIVQETSLYTRDMVNSRLLFNLLPLMSRNTTMREACFVMSNIAAEGSDMLQAVLDVGTLKEISVLLEMADYETRKEAFYIMYHAATSSRSCHLAAILGADLLSPLCDFLTVLELSLVADVMEALSALLAYGEQLAIGLTDFLNPVATRMEELGAKEKLEFLCNSHSMRIHVAAHEILEKYFYSIDDFDLTTQHAVSMQPYPGERDAMDETIDMIVRSVCL